MSVMEGSGGPQSHADSPVAVRGPHRAIQQAPIHTGLSRDELEALIARARDPLDCAFDDCLNAAIGLSDFPHDIAAELVGQVKDAAEILERVRGVLGRIQIIEEG